MAIASPPGSRAPRVLDRRSAAASVSISRAVRGFIILKREAEGANLSVSPPEGGHFAGPGKGVLEQPPFRVDRKELSVTRHYSPFADAADGYHTGLTSRKKIRTVTGPINLTSCKLAESSAGVFDWVKRLVSEP